MWKCPDCHEDFEDYDDYQEHLDEDRFFACLTCAKEFSRFRSLEQHCEALMHRPPPLTPETHKQRLQMYLQEAFYLEKVMVTRTDRKDSRKVVQELLQKIMRNIEGQRGGEIYSRKLQSAGSTATQTKIGKADEFDFNIVMKDIYFDEFQFSNRSRRYKIKVIFYHSPVFPRTRNKL